MATDLAEPVVWYHEDSAQPMAISKPAAFTAGELLVVVIAHDASSNLAALTAPGGWTDEGNYSTTGSQGRVWSHVYDGGEGASWNFGYDSGSTVVAGLCRVADADPTPQIAVVSRAFNSNSSSEDSPSVNPFYDADLLLSFLSNSGGASAFSSTHPSGMTDLGQVQEANLYMGLAAAKEQLPNSSATGVRTWTSISPTAKQGGAFSIAIASLPTDPSSGRRHFWLLRS